MILKNLSTGNNVKSKRIPSDARVLKGIRTEDLHVTVARVKTLFGYSKDKQDALIKFAAASYGAHTEEPSHTNGLSICDDCKAPNSK
jgi:hypothetical protein